MGSGFRAALLFQSQFLAHRGQEKLFVPLACSIFPSQTLKASSEKSLLATNTPCIFFISPDTTNFKSLGVLIKEIRKLFKFLGTVAVAFCAVK